MVTCGKAHDHPGELLATSTMSEVVNKSGGSFDYVLFDVPPVLSVADASSFLSEIDGIFLLTRVNSVPGAVVENAAGRLRLSGGNLVGSILNSVRVSRLTRLGFGRGATYGYGYGAGYRST